MKFSEFIMKRFKPKKVVLVTSLYPPFPEDEPKLWGGIEVDLITFVNELKKINVKTAIVSFHYIKPIDKKIKDNIHRVGIYRPYLLRRDFLSFAYCEFFRLKIFIKLVKILLEEKPDLVIIGKTYQFSLSVYFACLLLGIPYVVRYDWLCPTNPKPELCTFKDRLNCSNCVEKTTGVKIPRFAKIFASIYFPTLFLLKRFFWNRSKAFCVVSEFYREFSKSFGVDEDKIYVIPPDTTIHYDPDVLKSLTKTYKSSGEKVVLFVGRLEPEKGIHVLIEAFKNIKGENVKLIIIGAGRLESIVRSACKEDHRIIYLGYIPHEEIGNYYALADVVVVPSIVPEGYSLVIIEAMALNKPIVAFNFKGGQSENLSKYEKGVLVQKINSENLSKAIEYCLRHLA